ncbi:MAG: lytic transglycosylase domain-containing protein [Hyphomicrobiales bacterium]|nr:lytic transglycosylase domain-containing protein [Hyphomicrobiales bacterium]
MTSRFFKNFLLATAAAGPLVLAPMLYVDRIADEKAHALAAVASADARPAEPANPAEARPAPEPAPFVLTESEAPHPAAAPAPAQTSPQASETTQPSAPAQIATPSAPAPQPAPQIAAVEKPVVLEGPANALDAIEAIAPRAGKSSGAFDPPRVSAYAPAVSPTDPSVTVDPLSHIAVDAKGLREGLDAYRAGDIARGDAIAANARDPLVKTALEWALLRDKPMQAGYARVRRFYADHPDWPHDATLRRTAEEQFYVEAAPAPAAVHAFFTGWEPESPAGRVMLARALLAEGATQQANDLARKIWREDGLTSGMEKEMVASFRAVFTDADIKFRADRLFYKGYSGAAMRTAALGSPDVQAWAKARAMGKPENAPAAFKKDPGLFYAKAKSLAASKKFAEAGKLIVPLDVDAQVDGDAWWQLRRDLARKLLDKGDYKLAYELCDGARPLSKDKRIDAAFHAGWIALRYARQPKDAARHFDVAMELAYTPLSRARAGYWRGRAADALGEDGRPYYEKAAIESTAFYGQLARLRLGMNDVPLRRPAVAAQGLNRSEAVRVVELLYAAGQKQIAAPLAMLCAKTLRDPAQVAALGHVVIKDRDPKMALNIGKTTAQHGVPMDDLAFPTFGIPQFTPLGRSASLPIVHAIARQESAFDATALSRAGAMGLMQMIASTARITARQVGVPFDVSRMRTDPTFNAQLGAAHLGALLNETRGSLILTFADYNAGAGRVQEWINAHGDPRHADVDPIDWIERIPIPETRNYVQRVMENLMVYRARLGDTARPPIDPLRTEARMR